MRTNTLNPTRILLCASATHCAQVLLAAAAARVNLHGVQPCTHWSADWDASTVVLWALVPHPSTPEAALEAHWRTTAMQGAHAFTLQMLYGSAAQQAQQLAPWIRAAHGAEHTDVDADCLECLDAASEQKLFQHLLQRP